MAIIPANIIDDIMQISRIEEVIGEFVQLKKAGANYKGLSPFVDEKSPSFVVSPAKQIFKCFSTGKGGSVVNFLMEIEQYSYPEALRWLAKRYNIDVPEERKQTLEELAQSTEKDSLYIINEFAKDHFRDSMYKTDEGKAIGLSYFKERGFTPDIIEKFQLGYCMNSGHDFTDVALKKGYKLEFLTKLGLVKEKDDRKFDFYRGRVMFPIHSSSGRILGFGGRTLITDKKIAKYFNSPESPVYDKSSILYGLYFGKQTIAKYDLCYLVEGYTDVIAMHQSGVENVVASSGTSLTDGQIKLVKRFTDNITILYDGDSAGIKASFRGIDMLLKAGMNIKVLLFPDGDDPDSYSKKVSQEEFKQFIANNQKDFITFKTDLLLAENGDDPLKRADLIKQTVASIALIPDNIVRSVFVQQAAVKLNIDERTIINELNTMRQSGLAQENNVPRQTIPTLQYPVAEQTQGLATEPKSKPVLQTLAAEKELTRILVRYGAHEVHEVQTDEAGTQHNIAVHVAELICGDLAVDNLSFGDPFCHKVHKIIAEGVSEKRFYEVSFFLNHADPDFSSFSANVEMSKYELSPEWITKWSVFTLTEVDKLKATVDSALYGFKLCKLNEEIDIIMQKLATYETLSESEFTDLMLEKMTLDAHKQIFNEALGRIITE
jgi:DNA primase